MRSQWLHRHGHGECILFMTGWGMDQHPFASIPTQKYDIFLVYDYRNIDSYLLPDKKNYDKIHLIAWSMGVWVAAHCLHSVQDIFTTRMAIGGTLDPIHNELGIPHSSYDSILHNLSLEELEKFYGSMFTDQTETQRFLSSRPQRDFKDIYQELQAFKDHYQAAGTALDMYTHKIITSRDRIFPLKNQIRSWGKQVAQKEKVPHFPFFTYGSWDFLPK